MFEDPTIGGKYQVFKDPSSGKFGIKNRKIDVVVISPHFDQIRWLEGHNPLVVFTKENKEAVYPITQLESLR